MTERGWATQKRRGTAMPCPYGWSKIVGAALGGGAYLALTRSYEQGSAA